MTKDPGFWRAAKLAACFVLGLCLFELVSLGAGSSGWIIHKHFAAGNHFRLALVLGLSLLSIAAVFGLVLSAIKSTVPFRSIYFLIFSALFICEYAFVRALNSFSSFQFAEVAWFTGDPGFVLDAARLYFNFLSLVPILAFALLLIVTHNAVVLRLRTHLAVTLAIVVFFAGSAYFSSNTYFTISPAAGLRTIASFPVTWYLGGVDTAPQNKFYRSPREPVPYRSQTAPANNIVFVVDESVRPDYLSINGFTEQTTVVLEKLGQHGMVLNWGTAVAGSTCSKDSNDLLLTGVSRLPDRTFDVYTAPTIFQYARAMGYRTYSIDAQVDRLWYGTPDDRNYLDQMITIRELNPSGISSFDNDKLAAEKINEILSGSTGNFIWVNKYGVHKPYSRSYPQVGTNTIEDTYSIHFAKGAEFDSLRRSYAEAIKYNSRIFFDSLFPDGRPRPNTFYLYTSDHGQSLGENGAAVSHCSDAPEAAIVPLMLIGEPSALPDANSSFRASHANIFATLLDLMRYPESERTREYALSLLKPSSASGVKRFYYYGDIHGRGTGRLIEFPTAP